MFGNMLGAVLFEVVLRLHRTGCVNLCSKCYYANEEAHVKTLKQQTEIKAHQLLLLEMLKDIDIVCKKHQISYQLFAGTALGAVRHHGFIPWDDDVDIIMPRSEYERFFNEAAKDFDETLYYIQRENSAHWPMPYSKLRRNDTTCIEKYHPKDLKTHQGVYVDIFPCDNLSDCTLMRRVQFYVSKIIIANSLYARGYETNSVTKKLFMQVCRIFSPKGLKAICIRKKDQKSQMVHTFFGAGSKYEKNIFPRIWITQSVEIQFEDGVFPVSAHYDELLTKLYGNYHVLPSLEERECKEHVAILDLEHSYVEHLSELRNMHFDVLSRSIR